MIFWMAFEWIFTSSRFRNSSGHVFFKDHYWGLKYYWGYHGFLQFKEFELYWDAVFFEDLFTHFHDF